MRANDSSWKAELNQLLSPKRVAVVGATEKIGPARNTIKCLMDMGFEGEIYPIHPRHDQVFGFKCYRELKELPEKPDLVVVSIRAGFVVDIVKQCQELGIEAVTIFTSGFSEMGDEGKRLQEEIQAIAEEGKIRICGPNCLGHLNLVDKTGAYSASILEGSKPGKVAIVSQSGSMAISMYQAFKDLGISHVVSYGNQAVLDLSDYLMYLAQDPNTEVITAFIEGIGDGKKFIEAVRECRKKGKPIIAIKIGKSDIGKEIAMAHTAAIVGANAVYNEVFSSEGIIAVDDIDEMLQTVTALVHTPRIEKDGVALIAISGGQCGIAGDISETLGLNIAKFSQATYDKLKAVVPDFVNVNNPLDVSSVGEEDYSEYAKVLKSCLEDENIGLVAVMQDAPLGAGESTVNHYSKIAKAVVEVFEESKKPIVTFTNHSTPYEPKIMGELIEAGMPLLQGTKEALLAIDHLIKFYLREEDTEEIESLVDDNSWEELREFLRQQQKTSLYIGEKMGKEILNSIGISNTRDILCEREQDVKKAFREFGREVVMKIESPDIQHKTDVGGVRLGIACEEEALEAYEEILRNVKANKPNASIKGILMQEMVGDGVDLIIGANKDAQFGPVVAFGLGGIYVEVFKDSSLGLIPVSRAKARDMIMKSKSYPLLKEVRGRKALDIELLVDIIVRISALMDHCGDLIKEIDLNPVRINEEGAVALDVLIGLERP